jgi:hypothetical protein
VPVVGVGLAAAELDRAVDGAVLPLGEIGDPAQLTGFDEEWPAPPVVGQHGHHRFVLVQPASSWATRGAGPTPASSRTGHRPRPPVHVDVHAGDHRLGSVGG